jgi:hypothetical protein
MNIFVAIDDTDNAHSPGSGHLTEQLSTQLLRQGLATRCSSVSRHQLYINDDIPYTSHNSSMCFSAEIREERYPDLIACSQDFIAAQSSEGSDPGLCIGSGISDISRDLLIDFGRRAKCSVLTKKEAYQTAKRAAVHLSEHGGSGDGVIGAVAGLGLRLTGNDGRFRGWLEAEAGLTTSVETLCRHRCVAGVVDDRGRALPGSTAVMISDRKIKTVLIDYKQVIPVTRIDGEGAGWGTLSATESRRY